MIPGGGMNGASRTHAVEAIYASVGQSDGWRRVVETMTRICGATSGCIVAAQTEDPCPSVDCYHNIDPDWIAAYNEHYCGYDSTPAVLRAQPGTLLIDHVTGQRPSGAVGPQRVFYHEVMVPQGFRHTLALGLSKTQNWQAGMVLQRPAHHGPFERNDLQALSSLADHLRQGLELHARLAQSGLQRAGMRAVLEDAPVGVLFVNARHRAVFINPRAEAVLADTQALTAGPDGLATPDPALQRHLARMLGAATAVARGEEPSVSSSRLRLCDRRGAPELHVEVTPVSEAAPGDPLASLTACAAVWLTPIGKNRIPTSHSLRETYGLTGAEADVVIRLAAGQSAREIARARRVSLETVRSQLKSMMAKQGVSRQAELVRLVLAGPAMDVEPDPAGHPHRTKTRGGYG